MVRRFLPSDYRAAALCVLNFALVVLLGSTTALASYDDAESDSASDNPAFDAVTYVVEQADVLSTDDGSPLLPADTTVDRVEWVDDIAHIELTWPSGFDAGNLEADEVEAIYDVLSAAAAEHGPHLSGSGLGARIFVRDSVDDAYFLLESDRSIVETELLDDDAPESAYRSTMETMQAGVSSASFPMALSGPIVHGGTQPTGALTGVTVFVAAGHGWTWHNTSNIWYLQRSLLHRMNEDYGNIDQMNYFVQYLYNAGATVVPFRPVGDQPIEVVLDNDDPGVTFSGTWHNSTATAHYYENNVTVSGIPFRWASSSPSESAVARYTPDIPVTDFYPVYSWKQDGDNRVRQTYRIKHSGGISEVVIDHRMVGKGWIWLGNYHMTAGTANYVEITNASPDTGVVIADAIRFGNGMGDVARGSVGVSGYPREDEAQRYWAQSELGHNAVGFSSSIWDLSGVTDINDNVGTAARWAREMNRQSYNNDRWRRVYLEFHSNAFNGSARGTVCLVTNTGATTYQSAFATILGDTVEDDMVALQDRFEHNWWRRFNPLTSAYGAISTTNNSNEFDATIIEVAFHDNWQDAALLRDPKVRNAVARSCLHGLIKFLNYIPGSQIPVTFLPNTPENVRAVNPGDGTIVVSWTAPPSGSPFGHAPTGYKVYRSPNGYGFDSGTDVGNVLNATLTDIPAGETVYLRVAAYNAGGESLPSQVLAVRRPATGRADVLIVNGHNTFSRFENPTQMLPAGAMERPIPRQVNSFDYVIQHGEALATHNLSFDSSANAVVESGALNLAGYDAVVWILGRESTWDGTLSASEQTLLNDYLLGGGRLFISGSDIAWDLDAQGGGQFFYNATLGAGYVADDAGTYAVTGADGIFADLGAFDFNPANGAGYDTRSPDVIAAEPGGLEVLSYVGGTGGTAGVQYDAGGYRVVTFGFPFEAISSPLVQADVMGRVMGFLLTDLPVRADFDMDGDVDLDDFARLQNCLAGPFATPPPGCQHQDLTLNGRVDQNDVAEFKKCLNGANVPPGC